MVSLDPYCFSSKKLPWLNFCAALVNWKFISTLKNNKRIFCQVMLSFLTLVPIMRVVNWTRINQSLSVVISHDPYCYFEVKLVDFTDSKISFNSEKWQTTLLFANNTKFSQLSVDLTETFKISKFFIFLFWNFKSAA